MADTSKQRAILFRLKLIWHIKDFSDGNTGRMNHVLPGLITIMERWLYWFSKWIKRYNSFMREAQI